MWTSIAFMGKTLPYLRPYKAMAAGVVVMTLVGSLLALAAPWPMAFLVDSVLGEKEYPSPFRGLAESSTWMRIVVAVGLGLALTVVTGITGVLDEFFQTKLSLKMVLDLRSQLFEHLQRLPLAYHENARSGQYIFQSTAEADNVSMAVETIPPLASSLFTLLGMFIVVFRLNADLALLASAVVPLIYLSTRVYSDRVQPAIYRARELEGGVLNTIFESMTMIRVVQAFGRERFHFEEFRNRSRGALDLRVRVTLMQTAFGVGVTLLTAIGSALVLAVGAYAVLQRRLTVGELLVVVSYIAAVYKPLEQISTTIATLPQRVIPLQIAFKVLATEPEIFDRPGAEDIGRVEGRVTFDHCHFSYPNRGGTLCDVHFDVAAGDVVAIVGPTGAGKSTLMSLLPRFVDVAEGRVLVDGRDVRDVTLESLRRNISMVLQEPLLFSGTIRENILYGRLDATDEQVVAAAKAANAHDFIMRLPQQYETSLGERGSRISGGERQRIAVARAFLRDAPILILDEPTSSIDSKTEAVILDALDELMKGRTTFMIAHRLATVRKATKILVLHDGRVVQDGTHRELVSQPGLYREMVEAQGGHVPELAGEPSEAVPAEAFDDPERADALADGDADKRALAAVEAHDESAAGSQKSRPAVPRPRRPKIVVLGMMTKIPVAGVVWQTIHYLKGFEYLGFDPYYVEAHSRTPSMFMETPDDDGSARAAEFIATAMKRFGLADRWAYRALHDDGRAFGLSPAELDRLYASAELIINLHGGTLPMEEITRTGRLVYLETDPVNVQIEVHDGIQAAIEYLDAHQFHFTFAENIHNPDCRLPSMARWDFKPTRQPVALPMWNEHDYPLGDRFTTIGNWEQKWREVVYEGETYHWSKHLEFMKVLGLPSRTTAEFELALSSFDPDDRALLEDHGWRVRPALDFSLDLDQYRAYIQRSRGEFTVAKEQNVRFRTGWFSDRSATYLAAGRPVVTQDTGFGNVLPTGAGLMSYADLDGAVEAIERIQSDPEGHRAAAFEIAREYFGAMKVLRRLVEDTGTTVPSSGAMPRPSVRREQDATAIAAAAVGGAEAAPSAAMPEDLVLTPVSRRPLTLPAMTVSRVLSRELPTATASLPAASIIVVTHDNLVFTRLCLETVLANTQGVSYELVVVDNASSDLTPSYLEQLSRRDARVVYVPNASNAGFAAAVNAGLRIARGESIVILNNDVIVGPGWLERLLAVLTDEQVGLVGPVTNAAPNEARIPTTYSTYGQFLRAADLRWQDVGPRVFDIPVLTMFCVAMRREVLDDVGLLDEQFGLGMFEDDDYSQRVRGAGYRVVCADGVLVHHFGEASFGDLVPTGRHSELFESNRRKFEQKWGRKWVPHSGRHFPAYRRLVDHVQSMVDLHVPEGSSVVVLSKGDPELIALDGRDAWHFPSAPSGDFAGHYPKDSDAAVADLTNLMNVRSATHVVFPQTSLWWLDHYPGLAHHLEIHLERVVDTPECVIFRSRTVDGRSTTSMKELNVRSV